MSYPNKEEIPWHGYTEYPRHFVGDVSVPVQVSANTWSGSRPAKDIVDKQTLHGNYFRLYNDFLGTKKMQIWPSFANGYYINNMEPAQLKETLEKELARKDLPNDVRKRIQTLVKSLDEGGNNVVLFAKMKDK